MTICEICFFILIISLNDAHGSMSRSQQTILFNAENIRTYCFGHHLMDLPSEFEMSETTSAVISPTGANNDVVNLNITGQAISRQKFQLMVATRKGQILKGGHWGVKVLKDTLEIHENATLFRVQLIDSSYSAEMHALVNGFYVVMQTNSYKNQYLAAEDKLVELSKNLLSTTSRNAADSYCLGRLSLKGRFASEIVDIGFQSKKFPGISINITSDTYTPDSKTGLIERLEGSRSLLHAFSAKNKVIRKGQVNVASMKSEEWLSWIILGDGSDKKKSYGFALETMRPSPSPAQPTIHLELDAEYEIENPPDTSSFLSEAQLTSLWDMVSRSIRTRN